MNAKIKFITEILGIFEPFWAILASNFAKSTKMKERTNLDKKSIWVSKIAEWGADF
jgi:hypothetical protein